MPASRIAWLAAGVLLPCCAAAQTLPATDDLSTQGERRPKWEAGVAGVAVTVPDYPASDEQRGIALPSPYFVYHGRVLRSDEQGSRLRRRLTPNIEIDVSGGGALSSDSSDNDARQGMPDLGYLLELGPNLHLGFEGPQPASEIFVNLPVRGVASVDDFDFDWRGLVFAPEIGYASERFVDRRLSFRGSLATEIASTRLQQYFYEVQPQYATAARPAYEADAGYMGSSLGARLAYRFTPRVRGFVAARYYRYDGAASEDSPLFRSRDGYTAVVGFSWSFFQSRQDAEE